MFGRKYHNSSANAGDARRIYASQSKSSSLSACSSSISLSDMIEPPDYEELSQHLLPEGDPLAYPEDDVEVVSVPRRLRTLTHILPDEDLSAAPMFVRDCIRSYTRDYTVVRYKRRPPTCRSAEHMERLVADAARHHYDVDDEPTPSTPPTESHESQPSSGRQSVTSLSSSSSCNETLTPRGSWASLDLRSSTSDPLLPDLFDKKPIDEVDAINEARRLEEQEDDLLGLYAPHLEDEDAVEKRLPAEPPSEVLGHRILVVCHQLKLELEIEPLFASMALYDAKEKKKLSENFYFDLNSDPLRQMLSDHTPRIDTSTLSRSAIFDVLNPTPDMFLVIRVEKVLQGDVNECIEPYIKEDKNREKASQAAAAACARLGRYRMPLAWTCVSLANLGTQDHNSASCNSLDRKSSTGSGGGGCVSGVVGGVSAGVGAELRRRGAGDAGSLPRRGSTERRREPAAPPPCLATFAPLTVSVTSFFKQETDKLRDEDLYKFLAEIKRPSAAPKKLKCIPGMLKIEVSPCPDEVPNCITPELAKLHPYIDESAAPCKEVLPFHPQPPLTPHYHYRNIMFLSIREVNFTAFPAKTVSARNITVRVQLKCGEGEEDALPAIYSRGAGPELVTEAYTTVIYHNKNPCLYDEIKIQLPACLSDQHHLLFTFIHVACQRKPVADCDKPVETVLGYTWVPLMAGGSLAGGALALPVLLERPPPNYSYIWPDVRLPGTRWLDHHRAALHASLRTHSAVHPADSHIERFAQACAAVEEDNIPARIGRANMDAELRTSIEELPNCTPLALARYLAVVLDRLLLLVTAGAVSTASVAPHAFTAINRLCIATTTLGEDSHGRSALASTYIQYQAQLPRPALSAADVGLPLPPTVLSDGSCKIVHEELVLQWVVASGASRDYAMQNSWALFELIIKSMTEYLEWSGAKEAPRPARFPDQYTDDIVTLVNNIVAEIISCYGKNSRFTQSLNNSLAYFLLDLLSIADRGFVFGLVRSYYKQLTAKVASQHDAHPLILYKLSFLRIICSHPHFISLNLPAPLTPSVGGTGAGGGGGTTGLASGRTGSHSSAPPAHSLTHDFRSRHYLMGLMLTELRAALDLESPMIQSAAVGAVLSLARRTSADLRVRGTEGRAARARLALLFLPLLETALDVAHGLHTAHHATEVLQLDSDLGDFAQFYATPTSDYNQPARLTYNSETSRNLLVCLLWVLREGAATGAGAGAGGALGACLAQLSARAVHTLLRLLDTAAHALQYKGRKEIQKNSQTSARQTDIKAKLEDAILGQNSARNDFIMRRKGAVGRSERWRKEWTRSYSSGTKAPDLSAAAAAHLHLAVLHALELVVKSCAGLEHGQSVTCHALLVVLRCLQLRPSDRVAPHMCATVRALLHKLGMAATGAEALLCRALLRLCGSPRARAHAAPALYALCRHHYHLGNNFSTVKMQITRALSSLVGSWVGVSEQSLRVSLRTILTYAERDTDLAATPFPHQVKELVLNLHMILSDTVKMRQFAADPEMLCDLMHRVASGYRHSPPLRLAWLGNMAQHHMERSNHAEAAMCLIHGAALVAEQMEFLGRGAALFDHISYNVLEESCTDDRDRHLTVNELTALLEHAASELMSAGMFEAVNHVYRVLLPVAEQARDYKKLANIHSKLSEAFTRIEQLSSRRVFAAYFRVVVFAPRLPDLHAQQYVYREHALTKLPEITARLENFYGSRFGAENVVIIKESCEVDPSTLPADKVHVQITYVEPHLEPHDARRRDTPFAANHNIKRFMFATPFTVSGRAHGGLAEQCKRKTILTTEHHFPYVKTRIRVVQKTQIILSPIEVAIEDIEKKTHELELATVAEPPDAKMLQMVVQGCIGTTVNQGPLELAQVFLAPVAEGTQPATRLTNKLRLAFKDFSKKCQDALRKNKHLIGCSQREYQRELERNYARFADRVAPLLAPSPPGHAPRLNNGTPKMDYKNQT